MSRSTFVNDLNARIQDAERIISEQNENLTALRYLLSKELSGNGESQPSTAPPAASAKMLSVGSSQPSHESIDFKGRTSDIILGLVRQAGMAGTRPRDIAAVLLQHKLIAKGSNAVHSHLSELRKRGFVQQNGEGLYITSLKPAAASAPSVHAVEAPAKAGKKRRLSAAGREAIRRAQKARWAAARKAKG